MAKKKDRRISATQALARLIQGNRRFVRSRRTGRLSLHRDARRLKLKQRGPFAIVLSCSDSRAPAELLFDQGLGDLFVIRVAGNIVAPSQVGSVEFAAAMTQARLVVVMGHTECAAIRATFDAVEGKQPALSKDIHAIVKRIRPHIRKLIARKRGPYDRGTVLHEATRANVLASVNRLRHGSRFLEEMIRHQALLVVGAEYDIETGLVDFFDLS